MSREITWMIKRFSADIAIHCLENANYIAKLIALCCLDNAKLMTCFVQTQRGHIFEDLRALITLNSGLFIDAMNRFDMTLQSGFLFENLRADITRKTLDVTNTMSFGFVSPQVFFQSVSLWTKITLG